MDGWTDKKLCPDFQMVPFSMTMSDH